MPMSPRLLRPVIGLLMNFLLSALDGDVITDQTGDPLRTIQDA